MWRQTQLDQARAVVQEDQATLAQAQLNLDHTKLLRRSTERSYRGNMDVGQTVAASFQAPTIFLIAQDLTKMQVDTMSTNPMWGRTRLDQPATFTVDALSRPGFSWKSGQVREAPINVQNVITYDVVIEVSNHRPEVVPGMTANATYFQRRAVKALRLPKALCVSSRAPPGRVVRQRRPGQTWRAGPSI